MHLSSNVSQAPSGKTLLRSSALRAASKAERDGVFPKLSTTSKGGVVGGATTFAHRLASASKFRDASSSSHKASQYSSVGALALDGMTRHRSTSSRSTRSDDEDDAGSNGTATPPCKARGASQSLRACNNGHSRSGCRRFVRSTFAKRSDNLTSAPTKAAVSPHDSLCWDAAQAALNSPSPKALVWAFSSRRASCSSQQHLRPSSGFLAIRFSKASRKA